MAHNKILCGAVVRQQQHVFDAYSRSLQNLEVPKNCTLDFFFVDDTEEQLTTTVWDAWEGKEYGWIKADPRPIDAEYAIGAKTHIWNVPTFDHLAAQKQKILDHAVANGYTHLFLVDSDILLEPSTLRLLLANDLPICNGVFWTAWQLGAQPLPQCWLSHPYELEGLGKSAHEFVRDLTRRQLTRCLGGGACVLINTEILGQTRYYPRLDGLPQGGMWQGEDRSFAIRAQRHRIRQHADGWPNIYHLYHPHQREPEFIEQVEKQLYESRDKEADYGDLINFKITPLEDSHLAESIEPDLQHFRGRLGAIDMLPELEAALHGMKPGDDAIVELNFPSWWEIQNMYWVGGSTPYANHSKVVQVEMLDVREFGYAPVIADYAFRGIK
jgi:hypothetical protein